MSIFTKSLDDIDEQDLQELVDQKFAEWKTVEYKEALSVGGDGERKKFLSQVSSFANASGGHLIYGVRAEDGVPAEVLGMEVDNPDGTVLGLEDMIRTGIRPRIPGVLVRAVGVKAGRTAIVIRVPRSWAMPHQVIYNGEFRFYSRASNGKYILDVDELRGLYSVSETAAERIRSFRAGRLSQIIAGETPAPVEEGAKLVLHAVPLGAFDPAARLDLSPLKDETTLLSPIRVSGGWSGVRHNFDGLYTHVGSQGVAYSYVQVFRNGSLEAVNTSLLDPKFAGRKVIPSVAYEEEIRLTLRRFLEVQQKLGVAPPVVVMLSLLGMKGYSMGVGRDGYSDEGHPVDRDALVVPEFLLESFDAPVDKVLRFAFDQVWNATGRPRSLNFDDEDNWKPQQ